MINFYILNGTNKRSCTAADSHKAAQILALVFPNAKAYVVEDNKVVFAQNMSIEDALDVSGLRPVAPPAAVVLPPVAKPKKAAAKKTKVKKKIAVKVSKKKKPAKKVTIKAKPKKAKAKTKKPVKANGKGKKKNGKRR